MAPGNSVVEHFTKVQNLAQQLKDIGQNIDDVSIMAKILGSLPHKYNAFKTAWDSMDEERQTLDNLMERLIKEESQYSADDDVASALAAITVSKKKRQTNKVARNRRIKLLRVDADTVWLTDSGASCHVTFHREWLSDYRSISGEKVKLGDDAECDVRGIGNVCIKKLVKGTWENATIRNVFFVSNLKKNLLSVGVLTSGGYEVSFKDDRVTLVKDGLVYANGVKQNNDVYRMFFRVSNPHMTPEANISTSLKRWHERLGHVNQRMIRDMVNNGAIDGVKLRDVKDFFCDACQLGKSHKLPFKNTSDRVRYGPGEFIHSDVCGPLPEPSIGGARFFVTFVDEASDYRHVFFLRHKNDVYEKFKEFDRMVENKFGHKLQVLHTDNGREYYNEDMRQYLKSRGICMENSAPYTPEQNGKAERENRTIMESARTMIKQRNLPKALWAEAVNTAVYILNRTTHSKNLKQTPFEIWHGKKPDLSHVRVFGSVAYMHVPQQMRKKLDAKAKRLMLVGYENDSTNYRLFDRDKRSVTISRHVTFHEQTEEESPSSNYSDDGLVRLPKIERAMEETCDEENDPERVDNEQNEFGNSEEEEQATAPRPVEDKRGVLRDRASIKPPKRYEINISEYTPLTFREAVNGSESEQWTRAIREELEAHDQNKTWSVVPADQNKKLLDTKWVFKILKDEHGQVKRFKARLVARKFQQKEGLDYTETFAPKPDGLEVDGDSSAVMCRLNKSLYDIKQAARCWNMKFTNFLRKFDLVPCESEKCIFVGRMENVCVYLALFVDDGLIACESRAVLDSIVDELSKSFEITLGDASTFVGLQIERDRVAKSVRIHQKAYIAQIVERFGMSEANPMCIPADPHATLGPAEENELETPNVPYREAVGSLMFLAVTSRPDIAFAVNMLSRFLNKYNQNHWFAKDIRTRILQAMSRCDARQPVYARERSGDMGITTAKIGNVEYD
ncbi:integrase core domain protein [Lasius niger]|uniref:Integrase core domain protein n=1 Tax=Lasius niger TaxID=67767 RepID=A0A0J7KAI5_LASNI|nr:integrase core domain protein [Lasius niger]